MPAAPKTQRFAPNNSIPRMKKSGVVKAKRFAKSTGSRTAAPKGIIKQFAMTGDVGVDALTKDGQHVEIKSTPEVIEPSSSYAGSGSTSSGIDNAMIEADSDGEAEAEAETEGQWGPDYNINCWQD
jgi:hypothetical protein